MNLVIERTQLQLSEYARVVQDYLDKQIFYHDLKNHYIVINKRLYKNLLPIILYDE